jgi:hypothetical protein
MTSHRPSKEEGAGGSLGWSVFHIWVDLRAKVINYYFFFFCWINLTFIISCPSVRPSNCPSVPYFFAIFQPKIFKFWILREDYLSARRTAAFSDPKPRSSGIELRLGPPQIKFFSLYFINFWETINFFQLVSGSFHPNSTKKKENDTHGHGSVWLFFTANFNQLQENVSYHDTLEL